MLKTRIFQTHLITAGKISETGRPAQEPQQLFPNENLECFNLQRGNNVIIMGSPGCGKTTIGRILASRLGKQVVDVDNDHLEKLWKTSVADKVCFGFFTHFFYYIQFFSFFSW